MSEDKRGNAEQAEAEPSQAKVWQYIEEREDNLSRYSDKLRLAIKKIFAQVGGHDVCMVCGDTDQSSQHYNYMLRRTGPYGKKYRSEMPTTKNVSYGTPVLVEPGEHTGNWGENQNVYVEKCKYSHDFIPPKKVLVSLNIMDIKPFFEDTENGKDYWLEIKEWDMIITNQDDETYSDIISSDYYPSRLMLKELILSGRLPLFLQHVSDRLQSVGEKYQEASEIAEKLANLTK